MEAAMTKKFCFIAAVFALLTAPAHAATITFHEDIDLDFNGGYTATGFIDFDLEQYNMFGPENLFVPFPTITLSLNGNALQPFPLNNGLGPIEHDPLGFNSGTPGPFVVALALAWPTTHLPLPKDFTLDNVPAIDGSIGCYKSVDGVLSDCPHPNPLPLPPAAVNLKSPRPSTAVQIIM
jgi:hypothetical protein